MGVAGENMEAVGTEPAHNRVRTLPENGGENGILVSVINRGVERTEGDYFMFTPSKNIKGEKVEAIGDGLNIIALGSPFRGRH
jgi:hypothetical protein